MRRTALALVVALMVVPAGGAGEGFDAARAKQTVLRISSLGPRPAGSAAERRAGELVAARLRSYGFRVAFQAFALPRGGRSRNVVGRAFGLPPRAIVTAHLDGVAEGPAANDNASGVAVLLELARVLGPRPGLVFAALGAEERVETGSSLHLGAARLARSLAGEHGTLIALNLDMVGVGTRLHVRGLESRPNSAARIALRQARRLGIPMSYLRDPGWSDHAELARAGLPAAWIQWRDDACWHRACDRPGRVRTARLAAAGKVTLASVLAALESS